MLLNDNEKDIDYYVGVFIFNPYDDVYHLERIMTCIKSIVNSIQNSNDKIRFSLGLFLNESKIENSNITGVGQKTKQSIASFLNEKNISENVKVHKFSRENSCAKGYNSILKYGFQKTSAKKISVFADDYILPTSFFNIMDENFRKNNVDFIVPSTTFVSQENLKINIDFHKDWDVRIASSGDQNRLNYKTIYGGVKIEHIDKINSSLVNLGVVDFSPPPSFETTFFTRNLVEKIGFIVDEYYSCFYDNDYFRMIGRQRLKGKIAKNCLAFHYGKGGTKSYHKETADEKYKGSPVEDKITNDVKVWNKRWGENVKPWWGKK